MGRGANSLSRLVSLWENLRSTSSRNKKIELIAHYLNSLDKEVLPIAISFLCGEIRGGPISIGPRTLSELYSTYPSKESFWTLDKLQEYFDRIRDLKGPGSREKKIELLKIIFQRSTVEERDFISGLILGELRQGASLGIVKEAVKRAFGAHEEVERALMLGEDLGDIAKALRERRGEIGFTLFKPIRPMLASTSNPEEVLEILDEVALEFKVDGARIQIHRKDDEVRIFTRHLKDVTQRLPEIVEIVRSIPVREFVVEGEVVALSRDGRPLPFQHLMRRLGRKRALGSEMERIPLVPYFFDILYLEGDLLIGEEYQRRWELLTEVLGGRFLIPRVVTRKKEEFQEFLERSLKLGHEGVMVKRLDSPYRMGVRGKLWLKVKPAETLDLVIIGAEWGHGRRRGWLSNYLLAARDPKIGAYLPLGKTFKGLTDREFEWMTENLLKITKERLPYAVLVEPKIVVEVAFNEIQRSSNYPSGFALRFARIIRIRTDKSPEEADTIEKVKELYERQFRYKGTFEEKF